MAQPPQKLFISPDPQEPAKGVMHINLNRGDDLELDFDPLWCFSVDQPHYLDGTEVSINDGDGFESLQTFMNRMRIGQDNEDEAWLTKSRTVRMHLLTFYNHADFNLNIFKKETESQVEKMPPQAFGDLTIAPISIRGWSNGKVLINVVFHNTSSTSTIAVAMHDQGCIMMPCALESTLIGSDGGMYGIDTSGLAGINGLRTKPEYLTSIGPGQERKASLTFYRRGGSSESVTSFELQMEVVVNVNYRYGEYNYYRPRGDFLPPNCRLINAVFEIPIPHGDN